VTAHDFVYSWRRIVDPVAAAPNAYTLNAVSNAEAIQKGKLPPDSLGVKALDDFTLQIDLRPPIFNFLQLLASPVMAAVPRWTIEAARKWGRESSWTTRAYRYQRGGFTLRQRPFDKIIVVEPPLLRAALRKSNPVVADGSPRRPTAGEVDAMPERLSAASTVQRPARFSRRRPGSGTDSTFKAAVRQCTVAVCLQYGHLQGRHCPRQGAAGQRPAIWFRPLKANAPRLFDRRGSADLRCLAYNRAARALLAKAGLVV
jgi:hypothetical protein